MPLLSVIVPLFNVEKYVEECLESLCRQSFTDFEVICVDDGSEDSSGHIAKGFAARDGRFRVIRQQNQGIGPARNAGLRRTAGQYLAFADGDDVLPRRAYELLIASLERTGSDIACGAVRRFNFVRSDPSWLHAPIFTRTLPRTHIRRHPQLAANRTVWNHVYRRSFWAANGFGFAKELYEDVMVAVPAHVTARSVDVLSDVVYHWRERAPGEPRSVTQRCAEPANAVDRMVAVARLSRYLRAHAPAARPVHDRLVLDRDLRVLLDALPNASLGQRSRLLELARSCLADIGTAELAALPESDRRRYQFLFSPTGAGVA